MRFRQFVVGFLAVLSFCFTRSASSQLTYTIPVLDKSDPGSPLKISGTASFTELIVANSVKSSSSFEVSTHGMWATKPSSLCSLTLTRLVPTASELIKSSHATISSGGI